MIGRGVGVAVGDAVGVAVGEAVAVAVGVGVRDVVDDGVEDDVEVADPVGVADAVAVRVAVGVAPVGGRRRRGSRGQRLIVFQHAIVAVIDHDQVAGIVEGDAVRTAFGSRGRRCSKVTAPAVNPSACPNERSAVVPPLPGTAVTVSGVLNSRVRLFP